jgi:hypothetical protein
VWITYVFDTRKNVYTIHIISNNTHMKYPIVLITWLDASGGGDQWISLEDLLKATLVTHKSVGYLVKEDATSTTITMSCDEDEDNMGGYLVIPNINIINKEVLQWIQEK